MSQLVFSVGAFKQCLMFDLHHVASLCKSSSQLTSSKLHQLCLGVTTDVLLRTYALAGSYIHIRGGPKKWAPTDLIADEATFSLKLNVEQATEVNANKHLLVLNILSIKYSMYDVKHGVNYCVYTLRYR